jgi:hypothetical protein
MKLLNLFVVGLFFVTVFETVLTQHVSTWKIVAVADNADTVVGACGGGNVTAGWYCSNEPKSCFASPVATPDDPMLISCGTSETPCGFSSGVSSGNNSEYGENYTTTLGNVCTTTSTYHACIPVAVEDEDGNTTYECIKAPQGSSYQCTGTYPTLESC